MRLAVTLLAFIAFVAPPLHAAEPLTPNAAIAFFGVHFIDTSTEGAVNGMRADETQRIGKAEAQIRQAFRDEGFRFLDLTPVQADLDRTANPADCNGCARRMAATLGADYALVGHIQKVSNLILSITLVLHDVATGNLARGMSVDIRGNTDESWWRGTRYILRNNIFRR